MYGVPPRHRLTLSLLVVVTILTGVSSVAANVYLSIWTGAAPPTNAMPVRVCTSRSKYGLLAGLPKDRNQYIRQILRCNWEYKTEIFREI